LTSTRTIILQVQEDKADGLLEALGKRPYIEATVMDRDERKRLRTCPCCAQVLKKEVTFSINEKLMMAMLDLLRAMSKSKSVILVNKHNPIENIPAIEREICSEFNSKLLMAAEVLGLVKPFVDGSRKMYFTDALDFFLNEERHSPATLITLNDEVIETSGAMFFDEVKLKDEKTRDRLRREFRDAIRAIPESTITFVKNGQLSLV